MPIRLTDLFPDLYTADPEPYVDPNDEEQRQYNPVSTSGVNELLGFPGVGGAGPIPEWNPNDPPPSWFEDLLGAETGGQAPPTRPQFAADYSEIDVLNPEGWRKLNEVADKRQELVGINKKLADAEAAYTADPYDRDAKDLVTFLSKKANEVEKDLVTLTKPDPSKDPIRPNVSTTAPMIPWLNPQTKQWEWIDNPNYRGRGGGGGGGGGSGRAEAMLGLAFDKFSYQQEKDAAARALQEQRYMEQQALNERKQQALEAYRLQQEERKIAQEERSYKGQLAQMAWQMAKARMDDDARMQQLQAQLAMQIGEQLQNSYFKALPSQAIPGQTHFLGFEPGGIASRIARLSGRTYNPESYRAPINDFNPGQFTGWAAKAMGL